MSEYPSEWRVALLGDVVNKITSGGTPKADNPLFYGGDIPFLKIDDITASSKYLRSHKNTITELGIQESSAKIVPSGTLLLTMYGTIGECCITTYPVATNQAIACFLDHPDIELDYLYYCLSDKAREFSSASSQTTQANISATILKQTSIAVPPLAEQKKIAEILSGIDRCISAFNSQVNKLEIAKSALSSELISGLSESRKKSAYGLIPCHWRESTLGEVLGTANLQTGPFGSQLHAHEYTTEGIPVVMPQDMKNRVVVTSKIARIPSGRAESLDKHKVVPGDILFSRRGDIGRHAVIGVNESGWICGTGCLRARTEEKINAFFLSELLSHRFALEWLNANAVGQTMLNLNTGILSELPIIVPPIKEQEKIADSLGSINHMSEQISNQIALAQKLKIAISADLLSGRKRVSV